MSASFVRGINDVTVGGITYKVVVTLDDIEEPTAQRWRYNASWTHQTQSISRLTYSVTGANEDAVKQLADIVAAYRNDMRYSYSVECTVSMSRSGALWTAKVLKESKANWA